MRPVRQLEPWKVVWVGGQLTLAALVPALRRFGAEVPRAAVRRFNQVAWIAFAVLIVTEIWNVAAASSEISHSASYRDTLIVKARGRWHLRSDRGTARAGAQRRRPPFLAY